MLKRSILTLIFFEVLRLLCSTSQNVIIDKNNIIPEFVGIQYLWSKTLFWAFVLKNFRLLKFITAPRYYTRLTGIFK